MQGIIPRSNQWTSGGVFGTGKEAFLSYHNVTGGVMIGAAPNSDVNASGTKFYMPMGCESCHSPHGMGGNGRILSPDPNGIQLQNEDKFKNYEILPVNSEANSETVVFVAYPKNNTGEFIKNVDPYYMLKGYPYPLTIYDENHNEIEAAVIDNTYGYTRVIIPQTTVPLRVFADFVPSLRTRMDIKNYLAIGSNGETVNELVYYRDGSEAFCRACHNSYGSTQNPLTDARLDDYTHKHPVGMSVDNARVELNKDAEVYTGMLKDKFEENNTIVCLTCHAPHGVDQDYWLRSVGFGSNDPSEMSFSSCLKRSPNGSLCLVCHPWDLAGQGYLTNTGQQKFDPQLTTQLGPLGNQPLSVSSFVGSNLTRCSGMCHHNPIVEGWENTTHSQTLADRSALNQTAIVDENYFKSKTDINVSDVVYVIGVNQIQRYIYKESGVLKVAKNEFNIKTGQWISKNAVPSFIDSCAGCHVTGLDLSKGTWSDDGIACEACHGAASNHIEFPKSRNITNPRYLDIKDQSDICAQCHALGQSFSSGIQRPYPVGFIPHQAALLSEVYHDDYALSTFFDVYNASSYPGNFFNTFNYDATVDSYFPAQEFNDFIQSKHYQSNVISCITCHSSHKKNWKGQLLKGTFEQICGACHDNSFNIDLAMPARINYPGNQDYKIRVHSFSKTHANTSGNGTGATINIH